MKEKNCKVHGCTNIEIVARGMCGKHHKRWKRHGHVFETRPSDWGNREKHPLYKIWHWLIRSKTAKNDLSEEWLNLWSFVSDVKERPSDNHRLCKKDNQRKLGRDNWYWRAVPTSKTDEEHKRKARDYQKSYRKNNPEGALNSNLKKNYGITIEQYYKMHKDQNGVCAICKGNEKSVDHHTGKIRRLTVDHCHATGKIRGLLCSCCNRGLGSFNDRQDVLQNAIKYLSGG